MNMSNEYRFHSPLTLDRMRAALEAKFPGRCAEGDSAWYGDYLGLGVPLNERASGAVRVYQTDAFYLKLRLHSEEPEAQAKLSWERLHEFAMSEVVPLIQASGMTPSNEID